jgi:hypothetical protein
MSSCFQALDNQYSVLQPSQSQVSLNSTISAYQKKIMEIAIKKLKAKLTDSVSDPKAIKDWIFDTVNLCENNNFKTPSMEAIKNDCKYKSLTEIANKYFTENILLDKDIFLDELIKVLKTHVLVINRNIEVEKDNLKNTIVSSQFEWSPVQRDEMLRLLMNSYKKGRHSVNKDFDGYVIDFTELPIFIDTMEKWRYLQDSPIRLQVMVRNEVHYTAVDIELSNHERKCCLMDAYGEPKANFIEEAFKRAGFKVFTIGTGETLQKDTRSCSIFSLDHLLQSAKHPNFFKLIENAAYYDSEKNVWKVSWYDMPARFVKYAQSQDFFQTYAEKNPYVANAMGEKNKIEAKLQHFKEKTLQQLKSLPEASLHKIACSHFLTQVERFEG